ncbi:MAG: hypothetical protein ACT4QE_12545 [Anaerolineales bacterium]
MSFATYPLTPAMQIREFVLDHDYEAALALWQARVWEWALPTRTKRLPASSSAR